MPLIGVLLKCSGEVHKNRKIGVNYRKKLSGETASDLWCLYYIFSTHLDGKKRAQKSVISRQIGMRRFQELYIILLHIDVPPSYTYIIYVYTVVL